MNEAIREQRMASLAVYNQATTPAAMRALCCGDLFYLLTVAMKRRDVNKDWLFARCREVQAAPDGFLDLWARAHYKSTIITVGKTIQDILRNPEITVGIFSHTRPIAKAFLRQIKREFETNTFLRELFPHIAPPKAGDKRTWSEDDGLVVQRASNPKEATVEAWGLVDGQPTGKHFSLLVYDDVVTRESVTTPEQIRKTTEAWELSLNLGDEEGRNRIIGTRYHFNDTYKVIMERKAATPRIYTATEDGTPDGEPVLLAKRALVVRRNAMGPYVFGCQMLQNPVADTTMGFKQEWLVYADTGESGRISHTGMNLYLLADPAGSKKVGSDYTVIAVIGLGRDQNYYLIDGLRDRLNLTERTNALFRLHQQYRPLATGYERYGMQADIEHIRAEQERCNYRFAVTELGGAMPKNDRIRRLIPIFEQTRFYLPSRLLFVDSESRSRDFVQEFVNEEYLSFPVSVHDDMMDCIARITDQALCASFPMIPIGGGVGSGGSAAGKHHAINNFDPYA